VQGKLNSNSKAGTIATLTVFLVDTNGRTVVKAEEFPKGYGSTYNFTAMMPAVCNSLQLF